MRQFLIDFALWRADRCLARRDFWTGLARRLSGTTKLHTGGSNDNGKR